MAFKKGDGVKIKEKDGSYQYYQITGFIEEGKKAWVSDGRWNRIVSLDQLEPASFGEVARAFNNVQEEGKKILKQLQDLQKQLIGETNRAQTALRGPF